MNIDEASRATRKFDLIWVKAGYRIVDASDIDRNAISRLFPHEEDAQAACDRLNLIAVLKAVLAMDRPVSRDFKRDLDALIAEIEGGRP